MPFQQLQPSCIEVLDASPPFSLSSHLKTRATSLLDTLVRNYGLERTTRHGYKPARLIQATFEHVVSKDAFLMFFFSYIHGFLYTRTGCAGSDIADALASFFEDFDTWDSQRKRDLKAAIEDFAENFVANFLLPLKASSGKTPQPTAEPLASTDPPSSPDTPQAISNLRQLCFKRDHCRCVVSRQFDMKEADKRFKQRGVDCTDDDGEPLKNEPHGQFVYLEIGHILPYQITTVAPGGSDISESKKHVLRMLNMFDPGIVDLIDDGRIHSPSNALILSHRYHRQFGDFQICFQPTGIPHQYTIDSIQRVAFLRESFLPVTRTLSFSPTIEPPSPRLLAIHNAITQIIHLSGVSAYLDDILEGLEGVGVKEDGSTHLGHLTSLRYGGWY